MKTNGKTRSGDTFVKITRDLVESGAWRSLGINARRFIDFLMAEHLRHGGAQNGFLKAPHRQLESYGIGARYVTEAIADVEGTGLVIGRRGGLRVATVYTLAWLPLPNGKMPDQGWRRFDAEKTRNLPLKGKAALPLKGKADRRICPSKGRQITPEICPSKGRPSIDNLTKGGATHTLSIVGRPGATRAAGSGRR